MTEMSWHEKGRAATVKLLTHSKTGKSQSLSAWARELGIGKKSMWLRVHTWKNLDHALSAPKGFKGKGR